jgi:hypothetical protein
MRILLVKDKEQFFSYKYNLWNVEPRDGTNPDFWQPVPVPVETGRSEIYSRTTFISR